MADFEPNSGAAAPAQNTEPASIQSQSPIFGKINTSPETNGLSDEEIHDPNKIKIAIADTSIPIVVLFGPPSCGKTMTLIRMTRFLRSVGYTVEPDRSFRPSTDGHYENLCDNFDNMVSQIEAADSTDKINFMLVKVFKEGKPICQILESPGEYYFKPSDPSAQFPLYINDIINNKNRKIWVLFTEPSHTNRLMSHSDKRGLYSKKISKLKSKLSSRDRIIFLYNKIDETPFVNGIGKINYRQAIKDVQNNYDNIFTPFKNLNPITKLWQEYRFDFVVFQSGDFVKTEDGSYSFSVGNDYYPKKLWEFLLKNIRGH